MELQDLLSYFKLTLQREEGQTMAEYGVVLAVITIGIVGALGVLALAISNKLDFVTGFLK